MAKESTSDSADQKAIEELLSSETGSRTLSGPMGKLVIGLLIAWSVFQLWYASPLPFILNFAPE